MSIEIESWQARAERYARFAAEVQKARPIMQCVTAEPGIGSLLDRVYVTVEFDSMDAARSALLAAEPVVQPSPDAADSGRVDEILAHLKDPSNVHVMMLRGVIAVPSIRSMVDLRGEVPNGEDVQLACIAELREQLAAQGRGEPWGYIGPRDKETFHQHGHAQVLSRLLPEIGITTPVYLDEPADTFSLSAGQIAQLAMFAGRDDSPFEDQAVLTIQRRQDGHSGPGMYAHYEELPEEGALFLDGKWPDRPAPAASPAGVPDGWQLVPVKSTDAMHQAYTRTKYDGPKPTLISNLWAAMLAAAPSLGKRP